eukprot:250975-Chlamydomonas_euryale.AAC.1
MKKLDALDAPLRSSEAGLHAVIAAADDVIANVDATSVACVLAVKCPEDTAEAKAAKVCWGGGEGSEGVERHRWGVEEPRGGDDRHGVVLKECLCQRWIP